MQLKEYLEASGVTRVEFCSLIGIRESNLSRYITGKVRPSLAMALKIERATEGHVSRLEVLYPSEYAHAQEVIILCRTPADVLAQGSRLNPIKTR
jgi:DNA-binding transcriptional regulator YdaS (Cro superfamily)